MTDQRKIERRKAFDPDAPKPLMREAENRRKPEGLVMSKTYFADDETLKYIAELEAELAAARQRIEGLEAERDAIRLATIEECARVADEMLEGTIDRGEHSTDDYRYSGNVGDTIRNKAIEK